MWVDAQATSLGGGGSGSGVRSRSAHVFVSYRRDDVPDATDRLAAALIARLGKECVFLDVDSIEIGAPFASVIGRWVGHCDVLLAVIGRNWFGATDEDGRPRLEDPRDYVRLEIEAGLTRDIRVVPVLIHGVKLPRDAKLPEPLMPLLERNAVELSRAYWDFDVAKLLGAIERVVGERAKGGDASAESRRGEVALVETALGEVAKRGGTELGWRGSLIETTKPEGDEHEQGKRVAPGEQAKRAAPGEQAALSRSGRWWPGRGRSWRALPWRGRARSRRPRSGGPWGRLTRATRRSVGAARARGQQIVELARRAAKRLDVRGLRIGHGVKATAQRMQRSRVTIGVGAALACGAALALALHGSSPRPMIGNGVLTLSLSKPWRHTDRGTGDGSSLLRNPLVLQDRTSTISAGEIVTPSPIPGGVPPQLISSLHEPAGASTVTLASYEARRYSWTDRNGEQTLLFVLASRLSDIALLCHGPSSSTAACQSVASTIRVSVQVDPPGPNTNLATTLANDLGAVSQARASVGGLSSRKLPARAVSARGIADAEATAAGRLRQAATPARNLSAVHSLAAALAGDAPVWLSLANAARSEGRGAYMSARAGLGRMSRALVAAWEELRAQGFALPSLSAVNIPPVPALARNPHSRRAASVASPAQSQTLASTPSSPATNGTSTSSHTGGGTRTQPGVQPFKSIGGTAK
jgi:TIR domain